LSTSVAAPPVPAVGGAPDASNPEYDLGELLRARVSRGLAPAPSTENTGRVNAWFRMRNPTFYNTRLYKPLEDLDPEKKLARYMAKNTFIF